MHTSFCGSALDQDMGLVMLDTSFNPHVALFILPLCLHERRDCLNSGRGIRVDREVAPLDPAHRYRRSYTDDLLNIAPGDDTVIAPCDAEHRSRTAPQKFSRIDVQQ